MIAGRALSAAGLGLVACLAAPAAAQPVIETSRQYIIYGEDDRLDFYEVADARLREVARRSAVALIAPEQLLPTATGFAPMDVALGDQLLCVSGTECFPMCGDEPYLSQPSVGECSGVLIDDDLVLTAGHCFDSDIDRCDRYRYVFDYHYEASGRLASISTDDVYGCESIVVRKLNPARGAEAQDYAIVKLDRPVGADRTPVTVRTEVLTEGDAITAIGFPIGLPLKVDSGGTVQDARADVGDYFTATTDTFVGNSGSGLFDAAGHLAGHLVLGGEDFTLDVPRQCLSTVVVPDGEQPPLYEHGVYVDAWRGALCSAYFSERLCGEDAPPIKSPPETVDAGGEDGGVVASPKSKRGCTAAAGAGPWALGPWLVLAGGLLLRRRRVVAG